MDLKVASKGKSGAEVRRNMRWVHSTLKGLLLAGWGEPYISTFIRPVQKLAGWVEIGCWMRQQNLVPANRLTGREQIFDLIGREVGNKQVLYLEFGVYEGESIRYWSRVLKNPESMLHGFDSFEGLPERWNADHPKGRFSTGGCIPEVGDGRVKFFRGWFEDTLPRYVPPAHEALVINMDADLYSSTRYVLQHLRELIVVGTWLYFDEFSSWQHEFRAFREFVEETGMRFETVAECDCLWNIAFRRVA